MSLARSAVTALQFLLPITQLFSSPICRPNGESAAETFLIVGGGSGGRRRERIELIEDAFNGYSWSPTPLLEKIGRTLGIGVKSLASG